MRALVLREHGKPMTVQDVPVRKPGAGEVQVRVRACGLGLTLVWNRNGRDRSGAPSKLPRVIGHEVAGDVVEVGQGVTRSRPGDRVAVYFYLICGDCRWCNVGREDLCDNLGGFVGRQCDGGLAEYVTLPARNLCPIPAEVSYLDAAVATDAIATPMHVFRSRAGLRAGETALVLGGGGGVGVHMVEMARAMGARVIAVDISAEKLALAREAGADAVIDGREPGFDAEARRFTDGRGVDVLVDMVGTRATMEPCIRSMAKGGRLVLVGTYDEDAMLDFPARLVRSTEVVLTGSRYCTRQELADTLTMVASGRVRSRVTRICKLHEADEVLRAIERMEVAGRAAVLME